MGGSQNSLLLRFTTLIFTKPGKNGSKRRLFKSQAKLSCGKDTPRCLTECSFWDDEQEAFTNLSYAILLQIASCPKNIGRLWLAYTELQGDFTCYNSYLLTLGTLHSQMILIPN